LECDNCDLKKLIWLGGWGDDANGLESCGGFKDLLLEGETPTLGENWLDVELEIQLSEAMTALTDGQRDFGGGGG
jgi:hypothetical protein